VQRH